MTKLTACDRVREPHLLTAAPTASCRHDRRRGGQYISGSYICHQPNISKLINACYLPGGQSKAHAWLRWRPASLSTRVGGARVVRWPTSRGRRNAAGAQKASAPRRRRREPGSVDVRALIRKYRKAGGDNRPGISPENI